MHLKQVFFFANYFHYAIYSVVHHVAANLHLFILQFTHIIQPIHVIQHFRRRQLTRRNALSNVAPRLTLNFACCQCLLHVHQQCNWRNHQRDLLHGENRPASLSPVTMHYAQPHMMST